MALQATTTAVEGAEAAAAMLLLVATGVTEVITMATPPMEETTTQATTVATGALPKATMAMVAVEGRLLAVSLCIVQLRALLGDDQLTIKWTVRMVSVAVPLLPGG